MRFLIKLFLVIVLTAVIAGVLTYPLWMLVGLFADYRPDRIMHRTWELLLFVGLWWLLRGEQLANRSTFGYGLPRATFLRQMAVGFAVGVSAMIPLVAGLLWAGIRTWTDDSATSLAMSLAIGIVAGLLIAFIEETIVRGAAFSGVARESGTLSAILFTSFLFAAGHFLRGSLRIPADQMNFLSGFRFFADSFSQFSDPASFVDAFFALFAFAVLLSLIRVRTGAIAGSIGLHAGGVATISVVARASIANPNADPAWLIPSYNYVMGWMACIWISLVAIAYWQLSGRKVSAVSA